MSRFSWGSVLLAPRRRSGLPAPPPRMDRCLPTLSPEKNDQVRSMQLLSASDGWVIIDPDSSTASTFSKNEAPPLARSSRIPGN